ncbi:hypothetical protein [Aeromicrobium sp. 9AM]|uniref:hypothetical protein n=1 Tax=Aeromicrobium sp. 9AM TaxID=2653126 RepID=UPI0012EF5408|nr:hypothetical protein [Aeromicrobium sp. 9AM]VXB69476.1 conserved membrane hypothetical protein [Aeromicrobium sp. 9AM]
MTSRFATWSALARLGTLASVVIAIAAITLAVGPLQDYSGSSGGDGTDSDLYRAVATRVQDGQNFYSASVEEQRDRGYPVRPAVTVREPTLTWLVAAAGGWRHAIWPLGALAILAALATIRRFEEVDQRRWFFALSGIGALAAFGPYVGSVQVTQHECWAGLLIAVSLAVRTSERFVAAMVLGLAACFVRELAAPYLVLMGVLALLEHRRREAGAWLAAALTFAAAYGAHLWAVSRHTSPNDVRSPGWRTYDGLPHVLETIRLTTVAGLGPDVVSAMILALGLLGWASVRSPLSHRVLAWIAMWIVATMIVGRPENIVWGFVWVGPLVAGLVLVPGAVRSLWIGDRHT